MERERGKVRFRAKEGKSEEGKSRESRGGGENGLKKCFAALAGRGSGRD